MQVTDNHKKLFGKLYKYAKPYNSLLILVFVAINFTSFSVLAIGKALSYLVDNGFGGGQVEILNESLLVLFLVVIFLALATFCRSYLANLLSIRITATIREAVYERMLLMPVSFFETTKTSNIISALLADVTVLNDYMGSIFTVLLRNSLMTLGGLGLLFLTNAKLTGCVLMIVPIVVIIIITIGKRVRVLSKISQDSLVQISAQIEETINGIKTVKAFVREGYELNIFQNKCMLAGQNYQAWVKARAFFAAIVILVVFSAILLVIWVGGLDLIEHKITGGQLSSFIFYSILVASSIGGLSEAIGDLQRAAGSLERLFELLELEPEIQKPIENQSIVHLPDVSISFDQVTFAYPSRSNYNVVDNFSLSIKQGEKVALVGPSGAGKSTIFQLLLRFYDPESGNIYIGGRNIKELDVQTLRHHFALVSQETTIFSASAFDNIKYGKIDASEAEVVNAAAQAKLLSYLEKLPSGIHSFIGEKGVRLSGGQKQRLSIARALIHDPKILLLDEATSNLDTENEKLVKESLDLIMKNRTTIVIAHRLSTIRNADKIIVFNKGKIDAIGTHDELLTQNGLYSRLVKL